MTQAGAVIFATKYKNLSEFYSTTINLKITKMDEVHAVLESDVFQLVIHQIPDDLAISIQLDSPPHRREDNPIKLVFVVNNIDRARKLMSEIGGELDGPEKEWEYEGHVVCDGNDPEGNVFQLRMPAR